MLTLRVEALAPGGEGVCRQSDGPYAGRVVFVAGVAPGDVVRARLTQAKGRWARAELVEVLEPGASRVAPFCPLWGDCGGCEWQHVSLDVQRAQKRAIVQRIADKLTQGVVVPPLMIGADRAWRQRARLRFEAGRTVRLGFLGARSRRLVDVPECPVVRPGVQAGMDALRRALAGVEARGTAVVSASGTSAYVSARLDGAPAARLSHLDALLAGGVVSGLDGTTAFGATTLEVPGSPGLMVRPGGFTQANPEVFSLLVRDVLAEVERLAPRSAADLFAGAGTLTLPLARRIPDLRALEGDAAAVEDLRRNVAGLPVRVALADLFRDDPLAGHLDVAPDLVVLDPPREGALAVARALAVLRPPAVLSVACDPQTQARDLAVLCAAGYRLVSMRAYDAFPHTAHVETLAVLELPPQGEVEQQVPARSKAHPRLSEVQ